MKMMNIRLVCFILIAMISVGHQVELARRSKHSKMSRRARKINWKSLLKNTPLIWIGFSSPSEITETVAISVIAGVLLVGIAVWAGVAFVTALIAGAICSAVLFLLGPFIAIVAMYILGFIGGAIAEGEGGGGSPYTSESDNNANSNRGSSLPKKNRSFTDEQLDNSIEEMRKKKIVYDKDGERTVVQEGATPNQKEVVVNDANKFKIEENIMEELIIIFKNIKEADCKSSLQKGKTKITFKLNPNYEYEYMSYLLMMRIKYNDEIRKIKKPENDEYGYKLEMAKSKLALYELERKENFVNLSQNFFECKERVIGFYDKSKNFISLEKIFADSRNKFDELPENRSKNIDFIESEKNRNIQEEINKITDGRCCLEHNIIRRRRRHH